MEEKILIFGNGQIGNFYKNYFDSKNIAAIIAAADITKPEEIEKAILDYQPTVAINTAAVTNLEVCQENRLNAFNVNVLGADNIANACDKHKVYFIHFSSGCIFSSKDASDEKDEQSAPEPRAYYSWTKVWSENLIPFKKSTDFKYLILRPRQPISSTPSAKNMLVKLLTYTKFIDTPNTGTVLEDLMDWTLELIKLRQTGILNVANEGWSTPYEIALLLKKHILPDLEITKIEKSELDKMMPNARVDAVLNVEKLKSLGIKVTPYQQRLEEIIIALGENIRNADREVIREVFEATAAESRKKTVLNQQWERLVEN